MSLTRPILRENHLSFVFLSHVAVSLNALNEVTIIALSLAVFFLVFCVQDSRGARPSRGLFPRYRPSHSCSKPRILSQATIQYNIPHLNNTIAGVYSQFLEFRVFLALRQVIHFAQLLTAP